MKIHRLDAHDRYTFIQKEDQDIGKTCQEMINQRPFGDHAFYIFVHKREIGLDERISKYEKDFKKTFTDAKYVQKYQTLEDVMTHRIIWQPRLTKPKAQTNSWLFKVKPGSDNVRVIWMIPQEELWDQYSKDKMTGNQIVSESIYDYKNNRGKLEAKEDDDLSDEAINAIYSELSRAARLKPRTSGASLISL